MWGDLRLPGRLAERCVGLVECEPRASGEFVLYWAHHALRAHQNPALETAAHLALQLDLPLLVYQGLGGRHRYNSDRHHRFILEAARDFARELEQKGLRLLFHLPEDPRERSPLRSLAARASAVVSELYPVPPFPEWYRQHAARHPDLPWLLVDASCILPMPLSEKAPTRAFQFRKARQAELDQRVADQWPETGRWPAAFRGDPGFEPFELSGPLAAAIARCQIDHSIPPVGATPGGSRAGYRRWEAFLDDGLDSYHRRRNDAALPGAVSRLSPYLHYGCVSVFRIAADAQERGGEGAAKFLDELLIWRELSHHFCYRSHALETLDALPEWARESLLAHSADPREATVDWERLARGRSGDPLWDLAQRSLLRRGELHNNVRMGWGKAFLSWAQKPERALKLMIDLNHRFALDGSDPNSYGGLLWCLGQFDRAFPPGPVFGKVRQRSLRRHAQRLDMKAYARAVSRPATERRLRIAVVGAGLAGLTASRILDDQGHDVVVLDKARGAGGRMSTRRQGAHRFDHGAQYFTARDPRFLRHVHAWRERGLIAPWQARIARVTGEHVDAEPGRDERFVAVPAMNAICAELARDLPDCRFGWAVRSARREGAVWTVESADGERLEADALVLAVPPAQAARLVGGAEIRAELSGVTMQPCWSVLALLDRPLATEWDAAFVDGGPLAWLAGQASRPGRPATHAWVLHASPEWSLEHLEDGADEVCDRLLEAARRLPIAANFGVEGIEAHRWRYARVSQPLEAEALHFADQNLVLAGDWCHGPRVEAAFLSGMAAAGRIMGNLPEDQ
jgi:photolyase PhrII